MKYPMTSRVDPEHDYPYRFQFDLIVGGSLPMDQIPDIKNMVNNWLAEAGIDYIYRNGLIWLLKNEQESMLFQLRFS